MREDKRYLLRLWRDGQSHEAWRASLRNVATGQEAQFKNLELLIKHLFETLESRPNSHYAVEY